MGWMFFDEIVDDGLNVEFDQFADVVEVVGLRSGKRISKCKIVFRKEGSTVATGAFVICVDPATSGGSTPIQAGQAFIYNGNGGGVWVTLESDTDYANGDEVSY